MDYLPYILSVLSIIVTIVGGLFNFVWKLGQSQKEKDDERRDKRMDKIEIRQDRSDDAQQVAALNQIKLEGKSDLILSELKHLNGVVTSISDEKKKG